MVTELNHDTIKSAIVTLLQADVSIYDQSGGTDKLRSIAVGYPSGGNPLEDKDAYFGFVTNNTLLEVNKPLGSTISNVIKFVKHTVRYDITFVMTGETPRKTEQKLDTIQKAILETLEENHDISGNVDDSYPEKVETLLPRDTQGRTKQGRTITLRCVVTTA